MMKNLDALDQEAREREEAEKLLAEVDEAAENIQPDTQSDPQPDPQSAENGGERLFTKEEVQQIVSVAVARERVNVGCREYLLSHYYGLDHVSDELDRVLRILDPKSVDELAAKMEDIEALNSADGAVTRTSASPRSVTASLRQIFVRN